MSDYEDWLEAQLEYEQAQADQDQRYWHERQLREAWEQEQREWYEDEQKQLAAAQQEERTNG